MRSKDTADPPCTCKRTVELACAHDALAQPAFRHEALFYTDDNGFLKGTLPFIEEGLLLGEPVLVAASDTKMDLLKEALAGDARAVHFSDSHLPGRNPARMIPAWRQFLTDHAHAGTRARGVGEPIWPGRSEPELGECQRHESLLNLAFATGQAWRLICPYDCGSLEGRLIEAARLSHPFITHNGASRRSDEYLRPHEAPNPFDGALPAPSSAPDELDFTSDSLAGLRSFVHERALNAHLDVEQTEDLVLAVDELATNSVHYGGGAGTLRLWREQGTLVCEVRDRGRIDEPLAGRLRPAQDRGGGYGLWLVNHLCDLVQMRATPEGSVVRVHMRLP